MKKKHNEQLENPFIIKGYVGKELFCNRRKEVEALYNNARNRVDTTIISPRRVGKSGLIFRYIDHLSEYDDIVGIYVDIYASRSLGDFIKLLAEAVLRKFHRTTSIGEKFLNILQGFRPTLSYDGITGEPHVQIDYRNDTEKEHTLRGLLDFLDNQEMRVVLAFDEFQEIANYPERNVEALLRTHVQQLHNISFIFSGSKKAMMIDMFSSAKRPFYNSTQYLSLDKIDAEEYRLFIRNIFENYGKMIDDESLDFIMSWTKGYTFYTQSLCNMVFYLSGNEIDIDIVKKSCVEILQRNESVFLQYKQLLTPAQWDFLVAVAKEDEVRQITAQAFLMKHKIGTPSNARRISKSLMEKELLLETTLKKGVVYQVYDLFLSRWLEMEY